jgi:hypothetical protein
MRTKSGLLYELTKTSDKKLLSLDALLRSL